MAGNNQPDMNQMKQVRKALGDIDIAQRAGDIYKVNYIAYCLRDMVAKGNQPWSNYRPMIAEEFDGV